MSNSQTFVPTMWGGRGDDVDANGNTISGTSGEQRDVDRYRAMGAMQPTSGPQIDHSVSDESRGMSMGALGLLGQTAAGTVPSAAEQLGQRQTQAAQSAQFSLGASVRGGAAARAAANQNAINGASAAGLVGAQQQQATRAGEMAGARDAYFGAATGQRGMDLGEATSQTQLDAAQRAQNEQHDQFYEGLGFNTKQASASAALGRSASDEAATNASRTTALNEQAQARQQQQAMLSTVSGGVQGGVGAYSSWQQAQNDPNHPGTTGSDGRMKFNVRNVTTSDDRAKAAAWDEGHNEALNKVQQYRQLPPAQLKALGEKGNRLANAVRGAKADAYDEAKGVSPHIFEGEPIPVRQPTSFVRETPPVVATPAPVAPPVEAPGFVPQMPDVRTQVTTSDERAKYTDYGDDGGAMAAANRSMDPKSYSYKPGFAEREGQRVGETNVGPIAQNMRRDPVASTVIVEDPHSGLLGIDKDKGLKLTMGGLASLQKQVDDLRRKR